jgi:hypothetical protein
MTKMRFTIDAAKNVRRHRSAVVNVVTTGSKPCPHCHKPISANKPMCLAGITEFGTVAAFLEAKRAAQDLHPSEVHEQTAVG